MIAFRQNRITWEIKRDKKQMSSESLMKEISTVDKENTEEAIETEAFGE